MAMESLPPGILFFLALLLLPFAAASRLNAHSVQKTWCVAKPSSDGITLKNNLHYACSMVNCGLLEKNGPCFDPETLVSHASVAMNVYYNANGKNSWNCYFNGTGLVVLTDPSYGGCKYA